MTNVTTFPTPDDFDAEGALILLTATLADRALYPAGDDARADMKNIHTDIGALLARN